MILEKPMTINLDQAHRVVAAVEQNGTRLLLHSHASDPPVIKMGEVIASGRLGRLIGINTMCYKGCPRVPGPGARVGGSETTGKVVLTIGEPNGR